MVDLHLRFQVILFGSFEDITPTPEVLQYLIGAFSDKPLLPATFQELVGMTLFPRISLRSIDNSFLVDFTNNRIELTRMNINMQATDQMETLEAFVSYSVDVIEKVLTKFPKKFNRIALTTHHLLNEISLSEANAIYAKFFNPIDTYKRVDISEWNNRSVTRVKIKLTESEELINVISELNKVQGISIGGEPKTKDRIELKFDLNTYQHNFEYRFDLPHVKDYLKHVLRLRQDLEAAFISKIKNSNG